MYNMNNLNMKNIKKFSGKKKFIIEFEVESFILNLKKKLLLNIHKSGLKRVRAYFGLKTLLILKIIHNIKESYYIFKVMGFLRFALIWGKNLVYVKKLLKSYKKI